MGATDVESGESMGPVPRASGEILVPRQTVTVTVDGERLELAPGQQIVPHGPDRGLSPDEAVNPVLS